ncbi:MAG: response regulator [Pseudohongiella sp.]|nr:response regulator [Pseudohongiella sp.]
MPIKLVLIEDSLHDVESFRRALSADSARKWEVIHFQKAEQALQEIADKGEEFDLFVTDYNLPGMSGLDFCHQILEMGLATPLVILTGTGSENIAAEAIRIGVSGYIIKDPLSHYTSLIPDTLIDVISKTKTKQKLALSEELLEKVQRLAHIGHWKLNPATGAVTASDEFYRMFAMSPGADLAAIMQAVHEDDKKGVLAEIQHCTEHGGIWESRYRIKGVDSNERWIHSIGGAVTGKNGEIIELVGTSQDITGSKMVEKELQKMQKLESLGVLAGGIAHDFNNILTMLFGNISLTKSNFPKGQAGLEPLEKAEEAFQRASRLTNQLLIFAKGGEPVKKGITLGKLVEEVTRFDLTGSNVELAFKTDENLWAIEGDAGQLEQVFTNLAINAVQAMPAGGHLHVTLENIDFSKDTKLGFSSRRYVKATVRDEGTGIDPEHLDRVFDPYFTTKQAGNGLGLATVFSIIFKHGGHIAVDSVLGEGTSFTVFLPASELQQFTKENPGSDEVAEKQHVGKILMMDDEESICDIAKQMLESKGHVVSLASSGEQAIGMYKQSMDDGKPYDCIIMDLTIPGGVGGKEAIVEILKINPEAKAIVSSGYGIDPVMASHTSFGFRDVLPKPFTASSLFEVVNKVLRES